ncbi:MAG: hypothetical protein M1826_004911 [Phylliscum demangeonii]|nr:MAG: hypothetical protein M1826_004911 [Phylliscum demangeonii]
MAARRSSVSPMDPFDRPEAFGINKNRRYSSTGGGRAWTEDEEVYLLQTRLQKMPYKHIAAHLKKTELACRLHYHQLSHGTNRRKRAASFSSTGSTPLLPDARASPESEPFTAPTTPEQPSTERADGVVIYKPSAELPDPAAHAAVAHHGHPAHLLPKPVASLPYPFHTNPFGIRLDCGSGSGSGPARARPAINRDRLRQVYDAHRVRFWTMIAAEYGEGVDGHALEDEWRRDRAGRASSSASLGDAAVESRRPSWGGAGEERVVLPALQACAATAYERAPSPGRARWSVSSAPSPRMSPLGRPSPAMASSSKERGVLSAATPTAPSTIAALLNDGPAYDRLPPIGRPDAIQEE